MPGEGKGEPNRQIRQALDAGVEGREGAGNSLAGEREIHRQLDGVPVPIVHTESDEEIRVISFRRATTHEEEILFESIENQLPPPRQMKEATL